MFQATSSSSSSSSSNSNSTNNDTTWVWMTLVPLGVTSVVSVCSNAISCYNFFIAWNMISQMHRRDIQLLQTCSGNQQQQQKQQRQLEITNSINTKLYKEEKPSSSSSSILSSTTLPTDTTTRTSCPICLSDFEDSDEVSTSKKKECDHMFHKECFFIWLTNHSSCPYCRMELLAPSTSSSSRSSPPPALRHPFVGW